MVPVIYTLINNIDLQNFVILFFCGTETTRKALTFITVNLPFIVDSYAKLSGLTQVDLILTVDSTLIYRHLFIVPERKIRYKKFSFWRLCNTLLWKGNIVQDTPSHVAETLTNLSEVCVVTPLSLA